MREGRILGGEGKVNKGDKLNEKVECKRERVEGVGSGWEDEMVLEMN